ncbi:hypothetical protein CYLTODRAFT_229260 [Cylindrobasidium torrendii FP15055 ss-10]|uniref:Uncharacterized protein n=1 Tax=Cylindrobasidium torrendii FP15055 ss-10 TaxID=1314674 RepID=A0A0D7BH65_9AGAR|nr:hypothetical protein CYLTODRAFT_229260 [Cylindrobasidium torrendii FP15055 ss-10]
MSIRLVKTSFAASSRDAKLVAVDTNVPRTSTPPKYKGGVTGVKGVLHQPISSASTCTSPAFSPHITRHDNPLPRRPIRRHSPYRQGPIARVSFKHIHSSFDVLHEEDEPVQSRTYDAKNGARNHHKRTLNDWSKPALGDWSTREGLDYSKAVAGLLLSRVSEGPYRLSLYDRFCSFFGYPWTRSVL